MVQSKKFSPKSYFLCITINEIVQHSKSKPKKFSFSCTFKGMVRIIEEMVGKGVEEMVKTTGKEDG
jgi:hypothetical protein